MTIINLNNRHPFKSIFILRWIRHEILSSFPASFPSPPQRWHNFDGIPFLVNQRRRLILIRHNTFPTIFDSHLLDSSVLDNYIQHILLWVVFNHFFGSFKVIKEQFLCLFDHVLNDLLLIHLSVLYSFTTIILNWTILFS